MSNRTENETNRDTYNVRQSHQARVFIDDTDQPQGHIRLGAWGGGGTTSDEYEKKRKADAKWCEAESCKRRLAIEGRLNETM